MNRMEKEGLKPGISISILHIDHLVLWYLKMQLGYLGQLLTGQDSAYTWAQDERPADLHMAQPNVPVSKTGHIPPARLVRGPGICRM
jgi:hypothetical protein